MKPLLAILVLISLAAFQGKKGCKCAPAASDETTRWGGNHWIVYKEDGTYKSISGNVVMQIGGSLDDALVEIFDKPDYLLCEWKPTNPHRCTSNPPADQTRVAACKTGKDGRFCFTNIPAGKYELRVSKDGEWNVVHAYVSVNPNSRVSKSGRIVVEMTVGD